ncbi:NERD domain-containing protein [Clostridium vincentii]|uniref:DNA topoisomerase 1 n=1 Tax=Clostridium vincentii TaxID=52704 RepID=A0A2T0BDN9_9CLOT|nr:NERD domain-containing protein [Clostridium vincentii]PRR82009.1 DNA topoisomerase 1 [Clostridium vincentii]
MPTIIELLKNFWYIILIMIVIAILDIFKPKIKGVLGEKSVALILSGLDNTNYKVINNIMLQVGNRTTQIDHIIVSNFGIFVIETKNYKGWITGNDYDDYWRQTIYKRKEKLYNPIKQNYGHIQALKEVLRDIPDINYISIVAFTTNADLKVTVKTDVVYTINLLKTIRNYNSKTINNLGKEQIYRKLISLNVDSKDTRKSHVEAIHKNVSEKNNKIKGNICPRCGGQILLRKGKYGQFKGCSNFPKCRFTIK